MSDIKEMKFKEISEDQPATPPPIMNKRKIAKSKIQLVQTQDLLDKYLEPEGNIFSNNCFSFDMDGNNEFKNDTDSSQTLMRQQIKEQMLKFKVKISSVITVAQNIPTTLFHGLTTPLFEEFR